MTPRTRCLVTTALVVGVVLALLPASSAHAAPFRVTLNVSQTEVVAGEPIRLSGRVTPRAKRQRITLQHRIGTGTWKKIVTLRLSRRSTFGYTHRPTTGGTISYRAVKAGSGSRSRGTSPPRTVTAHRWIHLSDLPNALSTFSDGAARSDTDRMLGTLYPNSIRMPLGSIAEFRLDQRCTEFDARVGSPDGGVTAPMNVVFARGLGEPGHPNLGIPVEVMTDFHPLVVRYRIADVTTLRIGTSAAAGTGMVGLIGGGRVLCRF